MNLFKQQQQEFRRRHIGSSEEETAAMLETLGVKSMDELIDKIVPAPIRLKTPLNVDGPVSEYQYLNDLKTIAAKNKIYKSYIGQGYYDTITPSVILRNMFENPGWYTQYTPYQAEIAQGRLESLLNYQTMVADLTALPIANASLLDEATAAAEAMTMVFKRKNKNADRTYSKFFVDANLFEQTKDVLITRAEPVGIELIVGDYKNANIDDSFFGAILQYPNATGAVNDYRKFIQKIHDIKGYAVMATDLLALTLLTPPGELDADIAVGSIQRFGIPMGFGGPHAAFFAAKDEFKRVMPGRLIGISIDAQGNRALRMALQTREQHIKREKATSNICTAASWPANMAAMYAAYHGPEGLKNIARRIHLLTNALDKALQHIGLKQINTAYFDTLKLVGLNTEQIKECTDKAHMNFAYHADGSITISLDETTTQDDVQNILRVFENITKKTAQLNFEKQILDKIPSALTRISEFLTQAVFNSHHSENEMMRYIKSLENKDLSLNTSMISLGSCTMKLNAATELIPVSWPEFGKMHPFAPANQWEGYKYIFEELEKWLSSITGFVATSLQPNSGAQGEYAGLLTIRAYHADRGEAYRNIMLIPISAHGTNPASAVMAGFKVVVVKCDEVGDIDVADLKAKAEEHKNDLAGLMVTYPSTHGVFEEGIKELCKLIHDNGGLVYMDGANMNAQVGLTSPGVIGADVCHLNLHKTFALPHGGGGPGMGPICVNEKLAPYLPGHVSPNLTNKAKAITAVSSAPYGSASLLLISYAYIKMLGAQGITDATKWAILNANYMKARLEKYYKILYTDVKGNDLKGTVGHEFIVDLHPFKESCGIEVEDVAKRLIDYGFHAPTMGFPEPGTIMIEPTESEDKAELDRFCDAMISIYKEIQAVEQGKADKENNVLKNAPHTQQMICADEWQHDYTRQQAVFPLTYVKENKFWPSVARVNNTYGDRNLTCTCEPITSYLEEETANAA